MNNLSEAKKPINKSNIITLSLIVLVFGLPPVAAYFMYYTGIMPSARINNGTLIEPKKLPDLSLQTIDGKPFSVNENNGKWTLLLWGGASCDALCKKNVYLMRQVRTSLGKDRSNTERLLIMEGNSGSDEMTEFLRDYPGMPTISANPAEIPTLNEFFVSIAGDATNKLFLIDPTGHVMMHYEREVQPKELLNDLKRLIMVNSNDQSVSTNNKGM